jgi:Subtilase family
LRPLDAYFYVSLQAIDWAVKRKVDIISISWTLKHRVPELIAAVQRASGKCLIFCATADEGAHVASKIYPADCPDVIKVSASDSLYLPLPQSQRQVDVMIDGDEIMAHGPKYMRAMAEGRISGSSVATALAAGLASLCMVLGRMASAPEGGDRFKQAKVMMGLWEKMREGENDHKKVIVPSLLFEAGWGPWTQGQEGEGRDVSALPPTLPKALKRFNYKHFAHLDPEPVEIGKEEGTQAPPPTPIDYTTVELPLGMNIH